MEKNLTSRSVLHYIAVFRMLMRSEKISMKEADYMSPSELFGIGDVAKMFHISASSLRHYENIGILKPERVDPDSGYRYYSSRQFEVLNSIRYLRALDMPLSEIDDFLQNRDVNVIEKKLKEQKKVVLAKAEELRRIERKINNRLSMIEDARGSIFDEVHLIQKGSCRMIWIKASLKIGSYLDMETPIRKLDAQQAEATVFLGKIGLSISAEKLDRSDFSQYDGIFLILDDEDHYEGEIVNVPETLCVSIRFRGSHPQAPEQYKKLLKYISRHNLKISGFSREVTMIDYGITNDPDQFVTEISIPVYSN
ncbi:MAG: MerR family transcriptional regulator [Eubacterium pyruvativorans]|uniref:MerR family transcriptional regulator n=1 Tax=Eubacterium pyruvativorans TaxID=155865 RepID=UPI002409E598|nr:MerR family transcriptional regulator [Eubacterium pyruvativorans]MDD6708042.1 MerR family transcriptional regulator [Eubacterium pyruvativorans]